jgi:DNA-binding response OmpR family regulator
MADLPKILFVEDDAQIAKSLALNLKFAGYEVDWAATLAEAREHVATHRYDLLLLDVGLPDGTGFDFCKELREAHNDVPILFLSARSDEQSVVLGMRLGADDYIRKPFGSEELKVRIEKALLRAQPRRKVLEIGSLRLDIESRSLTYKGQTVLIARREFDILAFLLKRPGDVTTRESILSSLGDDGELFDRTIDSHMSHLRRKLRECGCQEIKIVAVYGVGYRVDLKQE